MPLVFQSVIQTGQGALKSAILINGGAAVALLAFVGNMVTKDVRPGRGIGFAMMTFVAGVVLGAFAAAFTYLCQYFGAEDRRKFAIGFNIAAVVAAFASLAAFGAGGWFAFRAKPW